MASDLPRNLFNSDPAVLIDDRFDVARVPSQKSPDPEEAAELDCVVSPASEVRSPSPVVENDDKSSENGVKRSAEPIQSDSSDAKRAKSDKREEPKKNVCASPRQRKPILAVEVAAKASEGNGKKPNFRYGNYNRYYGKRTPDGEDERLKHVNADWFANKCCLDVGCNIGSVTYAVAREFKPSRVIGIDIDSHLISVARKNMRHYLKDEDLPGDSKGNRKDVIWPDGRFRGPPRGDEVFPYNVGFVCGNYVGEDETIVTTSRAEYDTILCLSVTKWIHLNFGDDGIMRLFRRAFKQLKPGGRFILEPQPWKTYNKAKKAAAELKEIYNKLKLRPEDFSEIILKEVGFEHLECISWPEHDKPGFSRPIQIYYKAGEPASSAYSSK